MGYESPMPVQEEVIPFLLGEDNDVIALAQTGTGKTAAYGLPILQTRITQRVIYPSSAASGTTAIDQEPTSEAAEEIRALAEEVRRFLNCTI